MSDRQILVDVRGPERPASRTGTAGGAGEEPSRPLPNILGLTQEERLMLEFEMVDQSTTYARDRLGK